MKILIVDDEPVFAGELRQYVNKICLDNRVTAEIQITDDSEFLLMNGKDFDFVLLDIEMPKYSGIDLASKINEQKGGSGKPYIIFVTNRDGLVFDALKQQPFSFVRKSHLEDLEPCFDRLITLCESEVYYPIKSGRDIERIALKDIFYERLVFSEIHFLAQAVYHFYRRIVERYVSLARFAFQFADFNFEFGDVIQTISDVHFLYATL